MSIAFGTDGWRAIIGQDFIAENIAKVAQAFADLYPELPQTGKAIVIGYDRRRQSKEAAELIAAVLLGNNIPAICSVSFCPTPAVSWNVKARGATAGIMVTASHNPPQWNGIKFKEHTGGAASADFVKPIEAQIEANDSNGRTPRKAPVSAHPLLSTFEPQREYVEALKQFADVELIKAQKFRLLVDPLFGAGSGFFPLLLGECAEEIHAEADPDFGGLHPEPIPPYINELMQRVPAGHYTCGIITDGDADRAGAVDEHGSFVTTHEFYALLIRLAVEWKGWRGKIIKSISTSQLIDRLGKKYDLPVEVVPVGFKYISPAMLKPDVMVGGEESGGFGFPRHVPERDGLLSNLLLLELMAREQKTLGQLVKELQATYGPCRYARKDYQLSKEQIAEARVRFSTLAFNELCGKKLVKHTTIDGHHFRFADDSWLLFRASGTEPLIRTYAEAPTKEQVQAMLEAGRQALGF